MEGEEVLGGHTQIFTWTKATDSYY